MISRKDAKGSQRSQRNFSGYFFHAKTQRDRKERREILQQVEALKGERNSASQAISKMKKAGENADEQIVAMRNLGDKIAEDDKRLKDIEQKLKDILFLNLYYNLVHLAYIIFVFHQLVYLFFY